MNKDNYIIVDKTKLLKRIEELILELDYEADNNRQSYIQGQLKALDSILIFINNLELIPEIEKAFDAGNKRGWSGYPNTDNWTMPTKQDYIDNLKLEI